MPGIMCWAARAVVLCAHPGGGEGRAPLGTQSLHWRLYFDVFRALYEVSAGDVGPGSHCGLSFAPLCRQETKIGNKPDLRKMKTIKKRELPFPATDLRVGFT